MIPQTISGVSRVPILEPDCETDRHDSSELSKKILPIKNASLALPPITCWVSS